MTRSEKRSVKWRKLCFCQALYLCLSLLSTRRKGTLPTLPRSKLFSSVENNSYYYTARPCQARARGVLVNDPDNCQITQKWNVTTRIVRKFMTEKHRSTGRKNFPRATLSTTNDTRTDLGQNSDLRDGRRQLPTCAMARIV